MFFERLSLHLFFCVSVCQRPALRDPKSCLLLPDALIIGAFLFFCLSDEGLGPKEEDMGTKTQPLFYSLCQNPRHRRPKAVSF